MEEYDEQIASDAAWDFLKNNSTATIRFGENLRDVSYVITPKGELVIPAMIAMLQPCDMVMFVPEDVDGCMELHVSLQEFDENSQHGHLSDRWQVYHGTPSDVQWAIVHIDAARFHEMFIDGDGLERENPFAEDEASVCKILNEQHGEKVKAVCLRDANVEVHEPIVVGVDPTGIDVRATFGIVRIEHPACFKSASDVIEYISKS